MATKQFVEGVCDICTEPEKTVIPVRQQNSWDTGDSVEKDFVSAMGNNQS